VSAELFAGLRVSDFTTLLPWYVELLGEPTMFPHDTEAVWTVAEHAHLYIVEEPERCGRSVALLMVEDLKQWLQTCTVEPDCDETYDNGVRKVTFHDPDGNELAFGSMP
jgi:hypothetical protein